MIQPAALQPNVFISSVFEVSSLSAERAKKLIDMAIAENLKLLEGAHVKALEINDAKDPAVAAQLMAAEMGQSWHQITNAMLKAVEMNLQTQSDLMQALQRRFGDSEEAVVLLSKFLPNGATEPVAPSVNSLQSMLSFTQQWLKAMQDASHRGALMTHNYLQAFNHMPPLNPPSTSSTETDKKAEATHSSRRSGASASA